jgi:hypothetical protein
MIQSVETVAISKINKLLPKHLTHKREEAKIKFIKKTVDLYRAIELFGIIDFDRSYWNGTAVHVSYTDADSRLHVCEIVSQVMIQKYFGNLSRNENVFFYRFLNIFRSLTSDEEWHIVQQHLSNHYNLHLRENVKQYMDYRNKLQKIEQVLAVTDLID